jgi:hypothetical protein
MRARVKTASREGNFNSRMLLFCSAPCVKQPA